MHQKNIVIVVLSLIIIVLIGTNIYFSTDRKLNQSALPATMADPIGETKNPGNPSDQNPNITYLISKEEKTKFCDGNVMDSAGYKKTITTEVVSNVSKSGLTEDELVKETAILATDGMCKQALQQTDFKVTDGVVEISPIGGWAGVSITLCTCKPQVEVNLLRIPDIKQVIWSSNGL